MKIFDKTKVRPLPLILVVFSPYRGVVMVNMRLDDLDIDQCSQAYSVPNAFKSTARCDFESTHVSYHLNLNSLQELANHIASMSITYGTLNYVIDNDTLKTNLWDA